MAFVYGFNEFCCADHLSDVALRVIGNMNQQAAQGSRQALPPHRARLFHVHTREGTNTLLTVIESCLKVLKKLLARAGQLAFSFQSFQLIV